MTAGYSGTPLGRKLSLKDGMRVRFEGMPDHLREEIAALGLALRPVTAPPYDALHVFEKDAARLSTRLTAARRDIAQNGFVWVSWPKKASKVPTDITEDRIRSICLPLGLVDVKVCALDSVWSGLKLMIRKELREKE